MRVAVLDDIHDAYRSTPAIQRLRERAEVEIFTGPFGHPSALRGFDAVIANRERTRFTRELLQQLPDLKVIVQTGDHAYHIDFAAAGERGIVVARAPSGASPAAAELTMGLILALLRRIATADAAMKRGEWPAPLGYELAGKTLGIVGLGLRGRQIAALGAAFGMRLLAWSRSLTAERARAAGAERRELDDLLRESDVVTIHVALFPTSRGLIGARELGLMRPSAYLVNTSRGPIVDEAALVAALREGRIAGAGLDVYDEEPLPIEHPLRTLPNTVLTPHLGWPTDAAYARYAESTVQVLLDYLDGKPVAGFEHG
jgi:phosphoglycerate dehydrogenase-like enzyme